MAGSLAIATFEVSRDILVERELETLDFFPSPSTTGSLSRPLLLGPSIVEGRKLWEFLFHLSPWFVGVGLWRSECETNKSEETQGGWPELGSKEPEEGRTLATFHHSCYLEKPSNIHTRINNILNPFTKISFFSLALKASKISQKSIVFFSCFIDPTS